jgi:hypothetical protein
MKRKALDVARTMPSLSHHPDRSVPFDLSRSEVIQWLIRQPGIQQIVFDIVKEGKLIWFDEETGKWQGVNAKP